MTENETWCDYCYGWYDTKDGHHGNKDKHSSPLRVALEFYLPTLPLYAQRQLKKILKNNEDIWPAQ